MNTYKYLPRMLGLFLLLPSAVVSAQVQMGHSVEASQPAPQTTNQSQHPPQATEPVKREEPVPVPDQQLPQSEASQSQPPAPIQQDQAPAAPINNGHSDQLDFMRESKPMAYEQPSMFGLILRTVGALMLVLGMIIGGGWALKRYGGSRFGGQVEGGPALSVLSSVPLGDKRSLSIVKFGDHTLLIGSTPHQVSLLAEDYNSSYLSTAKSVAEMLTISDEQYLEEPKRSFGDNSARHRGEFA
jgi:flagellar biosynthetic protein FliO